MKNKILNGILFIALTFIFVSCDCQDVKIIVDDDRTLDVKKINDENKVEFQIEGNKNCQLKLDSSSNDKVDIDFEKDTIILDDNGNINTYFIIKFDENSNELKDKIEIIVRDKDDVELEKKSINIKLRLEEIGKITSPENNSKQESSFMVNGKIKNEIANDEYIWILLEAHESDGYFPQSEILKGEVNFSKKVKLGDKSGEKYSVLLVIVDNKTNDKILKWKNTGDEKLENGETENVFLALDIDIKKQIAKIDIEAN